MDEQIIYNGVKQKIKKYAKTDKYDIIALILTIIFSFTALYEIMFRANEAYSYIHTVIYIVSIILSTIYISSKQKFNKKSIPMLIGCISLSLPLSIHNDLGMNTICILLLIFLTNVYFTVLTKSNKHKISSFMFLSDLIHTSFFSVIKNLFYPYLSLNKTRKINKNTEKKKNKNILYGILGVLAGLLFLCIIIPLLLSGDAMFENTIENIFGNLIKSIGNFIENIGSNIIKGLLTLNVTIYVFPFLYSAMFSFRHGDAKNENKDKSDLYIKIRKAPQIFFNIFLGLVCAVYALYTVTQLAYLFSAFAGRLPQNSNLSISEYARRGFFEMTAIAVINFILISLTVLFAKRKDSRIFGTIKLFDLFLSLFTILTSVISVSKILLYINQYGLTYKRILILAVNIIIIITFLSIILKLFIKKFPYMSIIIITFSTVIIILSIFGVNNLAVKYNSYLYYNGNSQDFDFSTFSNYAGFENLLNIAKNGNKDAETELSNYYAFTLSAIENDNNKTDNLEQKKVYALIGKNKDYLEKLMSQNEEYRQYISDIYTEELF